MSARASIRNTAIRALDCRRSVGGRLSRITWRRTLCPRPALPNWAVFRSRRRRCAAPRAGT